MTVLPDRVQYALVEDRLRVRHSGAAEPAISPLVLMDPDDFITALVQIRYQLTASAVGLTGIFRRRMPILENLFHPLARLYPIPVSFFVEEVTQP